MNARRHSGGKSRKAAALLLSAAMASLSVLSACGKSEETGGAEASASPQANSSASAEPAANTMPIVKDGSVTLTFMGNENFYAAKSYKQNLPVWQEIEKRTGVKTIWDVTPSSQYVKVAGVRVAAAKDLPDIMLVPQDPVKTAEDGLIIPLDGLIDKHAPNIKKFFKENPILHNRLKAPDGKLYFISSITDGAAYTDPIGLLLRKDWLEKLDLQEPRTLDEWYAVLKAFKDRDPNGNGKPDEIPLSFANHGMNGLTMFASALNLHFFYSQGFYPDKNGKIQFEWADPRAKELLVWLNKLYSEGLIDPEFLTKKDDALVGNISRDMVGASVNFLNQADRYNAAQKQSGSDKASWMLALPPTGKDSKGYYEKYGPFSGYFAISSTSKNPEVAIKWLDYIYASEEGSRLVHFGIEGTSYNMVNGQPEFTDFVKKNPEGLDAVSALRSIGAYPTVPWIRSQKGFTSLQPQALLKLNPVLAEQAKRIETSLVDAVPFGFASPKENEEVSTTVSADFKTYLDETLVKFVTGKEPLDNFDKFTAKLQSMGLAKLLELKQKQYDRATKK